jgi:impB/mucB/samB family protein
MFATIYLPNFFLQAAARHQTLSAITPIALIEEKEKKPVIIQLNQAAEAAGVRIGMTPSQGLARYLSLIIKTRSPAKEQSLANLVLQYAFSLSPSVEATRPGLWTIQFTRNHDLHGKLSFVVQRLLQSEVISQAGIASTPDMSFLAAHLARPVLQIENPEQFLGPLSIDILAISFQR